MRIWCLKIDIKMPPENLIVVQSTLLHLCVSRRPFGLQLELGATHVTKYSFKHFGWNAVREIFVVIQEAKCEMREIPSSCAPHLGP